MAKIDLDFDGPRGIAFADDDGRIGVVTTMLDHKGNVTQDPAEACALVVFMGLECPEGSWLSVQVEPGAHDVATRTDFLAVLPAGSA